MSSAPGEPALQVTEITATQYVILAENQQKKRALAETKQKYQSLQDENRKLLRQYEDLQRETYEVSEHLRRELLEKAEKLAELESEVQQLKDQKDSEVARIAFEAAAREKKARSEHDHNAKEMSNTISELRSELASVLDFKTRQQEVESELLQLKEENHELKEKLATQRSEMERYYIEQNQKLKKEYEQRYQELKKAAEEDLDDRLDSSVKRILQQNNRLAEELKVHVQETDTLQAEVRILEDERTRLMRELALKVELEEGYAKRSAKQSILLKDSSLKNTQLEDSMQQLLQTTEQERTALMEACQKQINDVKAECEALRRLVKLKSRELKNIRRLAQEVLLQRSDVESFLLSSLHHVRKEVERANLDGPKANQLRTVAQGAKIDIKELAWEDREKILRLLFAKINNQAQQSYFSNLPAHSFAQQAAKGPAAPSLHGARSGGRPDLA